jgi:DNA (cytosine-5)-methyltransferase 1
VAPYYFSKNVNGYVTGKRFSVDRPAVTVMAHGMGGDHWRSWLVANDGGADRMPRAETKPPYRVPSMAEIAAIPPNGLTVATFFAGAGGSSLGYRMAGFRVLYANEFVPIAQESYRANAAPGTVVDGRDVREVTAADVLKACGLEAGELDVLDGSPPCQAFSTAGRREKGWGKDREYAHGAKQKNEELFTDFIRLRDGIMPRAFVAENVSGLVKGAAKGFFLEILKELRRGYRVTCPLLDAQWLGVPQARQRIVFIGVRDDLGLDPPVIAPLPYRYSVRDALPWIGRAVHDTGGQPQYSGGDITNRPTVTIMSSPRDANHFRVEEARVVHQTHGQHKSQGDVTDKPSPVIVSRPASFAVERVVHDSGRGKARDITDRPAPTITAGPDDPGDGGGPRNHFKVEVVGNKNAPHSRKGERRSVDQPVRTLTSRRANVELQRTVEPETDISGNAIGAEYDRLNPGQQSDKYFSLVRAAPDDPCPTITAAGGQSSGIACVVHPTEKRKFSILEVKRLCSFPDDFELKGTYGNQWERLGNSVPPLMMKAVAEAVRDKVLLPWKETQSRAKKQDARKQNRRKVLVPSRQKGA